MTENVVKPESHLTRFEEELNKKYPIGLVPRQDLTELTNGLVRSTTLANLKSSGAGVDNPVKVGKKICHYIPDIINYIRKYTSTSTNSQENI